MVCKILSWSRKTGTFKGVAYDNITLYALSMKSTYENANTVLQGHPVEFHTIPVKVRYWNDVCSIPLTEENLNNLIGCNCKVSFGLATYDGKQFTRIDSLDIIEGGKDNA